MHWGNDTRVSRYRSGGQAAVPPFVSPWSIMIANGGIRNVLDLNHEERETRQRYRCVEQFLEASRSA